MKVVVAAAELAERFAGIAGAPVRVAVGEPPSGWHAYTDADQADTRFEPDGPTHATDPLFLYFTSGTTAQPKLVEHTHASYPVGHLSTMYWLGLRPDDVHLNVSSPGWAKHAWSNLFAPWNAGATVLVHDTARFDAAVQRRRLYAFLARRGYDSDDIARTLRSVMSSEARADAPAAE